MKSETYTQLVPCRNKPVIVAEYNETGYTVISQLGTHTIEIYSAGNHRMESQSYAELGTSMALPLRTLRRFAIRTAKELAGVRKLKYTGVTRVYPE